VRVILDHEQSSLGPGPHAPKWARWLSRQDQPRGLVDVIADEARSCLSEAGILRFLDLMRSFNDLGDRLYLHFDLHRICISANASMHL
jgi:hypothetical protein